MDAISPASVGRGCPCRVAPCPPSTSMLLPCANAPATMGHLPCGRPAIPRSRAGHTPSHPCRRGEQGSERFVPRETDADPRLQACSPGQQHHGRAHRAQLQTTAREPVPGAVRTDAQRFPASNFTCSFDSLSRVLFNFPSQYLFAIGLSLIFSLGWRIPPHLSCTPKQPDSLKTALMATMGTYAANGTVTLHGAPFQRT